MARLRDANPKPKLWKKFDTPVFGAGRNVRFGDLDGDGVPEMLFAQNIPRIRGDAEAIAAAAELLAKAERPVIIAGDAVAQSRAHKELVALAEAIGAPVYVEFIPSTA